MRLLSLRDQFSAVAVCAVVTVILYAPVFWGSVEFVDSLVLSLTALITLFFWALTAILSKRDAISANAKKSSVATGGAAVLYALTVSFVVLVFLQILPLGQSAVRLLSPTKWALSDRLKISEAANTLSVNTYITEMHLYRVTGYVALFFVVSKVARSRKVALTFAGAMTAVAAAVSFYGLMQYFTDNQLPSLYQKRYYLDRATGPFVNANHFSGFLEICLPICLSLLFVGSKQRQISAEFSLTERMRFFMIDLAQRPYRLILLGVAVLISLGILFSMSRLGILSACVSLLIFAAVAAAGSARSKIARLSAVLGITGIIIGANILMGLDEVSRRYSVLFDRDVGWRLGVWNWSLKVALDYPVAGTGLGTFQSVSPIYKALQTNAGQFDEAHNDYLNLWSDTGTIGLILGLSFVAVWLVVVLRRMRGLRRYQSFLLAGCVSSLFAMLVHSIGDFNLQIPSNAAYLAIILGIGIALSEKRHNISATTPVREISPSGAK
jgi:O-antigen ligase